ncbi:MAG TPA: NAD(P)/FAD-dependent oxidoreductase [Candidatus Scybalocola faecigallinarum]|uniref:NAD(P)/FAD-dependent oxidoreductase n=1 Tax=Candidatus Scybalocola faecigallinarum TaxID=2840941 RepID=A0A9D1F340_9FIRM|nr:NAD(P)/FAD-dependent oxidoreductase [Candidatus Scybalocola faecigallinarum]
MYDAVIIGAGVVGCAIARELSKFKIKACVVEREEDVCCGTSKANSAIVHAGYDAENGTLKAKLNVEGNALMEQLSKDLDFPFKRNGSLVTCTGPEGLPVLEMLKARGIKNGVPGLEILNREQLLAIEPNLSDQVIAALYAPTGGIVCPFNLTIALAENALANGVEFRRNTQVTHVRPIDLSVECPQAALTFGAEGYAVETGQEVIYTRTVINAAGVYADVFHNMVSSHKLHITARKGEYCLLDKGAGNHVSHTIFQLPNAMGKGVLVTPTVHGNLLVGPTAEDIENKEGTNTTRKGLDYLTAKAGESVKNLPMRQVITSFAGLRAHEDGDEFVIGEAEDAPGFFDAAGIESPGLTSAPAIGVMVAGLVAGKLELEKNPDFIGTRKGIPHLDEMTMEARAELIRKNPAYGNIICRCEMVSEGEILDAIHRPLGARSLDGVKRRVRAGMGRCQAGFCSPKTMEILEREVPLSMVEITKSGPGSHILVGRNGGDINAGI